MTFTWPWALLALVVIPISIGAYLLLRRRKRKFAVSYASLSLIREARPERSRWRRLIPASLRVPEIPYDDYVALILAEEYFSKILGNMPPKPET